MGYGCGFGISFCSLSSVARKFSGMSAIALNNKMYLLQSTLRVVYTYAAKFIYMWTYFPTIKK